tara:strand:- start:342 stop:782 length:441 start_codon:yes stop_codon:yes gene_type:complete
MNRSRISQLRTFLDDNPSIPLAVIDNALTIHAIACNKKLPLEVMRTGFEGDIEDGELMTMLVALSEYKFKSGGKFVVAVMKWQRDCDGCEGYSSHLVEATPDAFEDWQCSQYEEAEGPLSLEMIYEDEYRDFRSSFRDTYAEAMGY